MLVYCFTFVKSITECIESIAEFPWNWCLLLCSLGQTLCYSTTSQPNYHSLFVHMSKWTDVVRHAEESEWCEMC